MKGILSKIFIPYALVAVIGFTVLGTTFIVQVNNYSSKEKEQLLEKTSDRISDLTTILIQNYSSSLESLYKVNVSQLADDANATVIICDEQGRVAYIANSEECYAPINTILNTEPVKKVFSSGEYNSVGNLYGFFSDSMYTVGVPLISAGGSTIGAVFLSSPAGAVFGLFQVIWKIFFFTTLITLLVMLAASFFIAQRMSKPLKQMAAAVRSFAKGDFSVRVPETESNDEISELAHNFNYMATSLSEIEEQRSNFVANISHDLRTPMTTISGFVDGILDGTIPQEKQDDYLKIISSEVKRLSSLASRMLNAAKIESGGFKLSKSQFDICELTARIMLSFEKNINEKNIEIDIDMPDTLALLADRDTMFQVIYNLVDNAVKYTPFGGAITLKLWSSSGKFHFKITNTGQTLSDEVMMHIFDRFYKADYSRSINKQSSGLGLFIVKTSINLHSGDISVRSENGLTEFYFLIPAS